MALVKFGPIVGAASGKLGSICFSRQGGASIVRTQPIAKGPPSAAQMSNDATFARAQSTWRSLPAADRLTWTTAARQLPSANRLGLSRQLSGYQLYLQSTMLCLLGGVAVQDTFSSDIAKHWSKVASIELWPGGPANLVLDTPTASGVPHNIVRAQRTHRTHPGLPGQLWRVINRDDVLDYSLNFWQDLTAAFGTPAPLEYFRFEVTQWIPGWPHFVTTRSLVQIPNVGAELIVNGDFEIPLVALFTWDKAGDGTLQILTTYPWGDGHSARWLVPGGAAPTYFFTAIPVRWTWTPSSAYTFRMAYRGDSGAITHITAFASGAPEVQIHGVLADTSAVWKTLEVGFTSPTAAAGGGIYFYNNANQDAHFSFDNISIRKDTP